MSGVAPAPEGITNPPIDELLERTSSKYGLVIFAAKRARQINAYYSQLSEGLLEYVGPLVATADAQHDPTHAVILPTRERTRQRLPGAFSSVLGCPPTRAG